MAGPGESGPGTGGGSDSGEPGRANARRRNGAERDGGREDPPRPGAAPEPDFGGIPETEAAPPAGAGAAGRPGRTEGTAGAEGTTGAPGTPVRTADFRFDLPDDRIARRPARRRGDSRLLHLAADGTVTHHRFADLPRLLRPGDLLVRNRTRVIPARFAARREGTGGRVEVLALPGPGSRGAPEFAALTRPACRPGVLLSVGDSVRLRVGEPLREGKRRVRILEGAGDVFDLAEREGSTPLPPYLRRKPEEGAGDDGRLSDRERYQTVYAEEPGSVAAPTAGLHFEAGFFDQLAERGVETADLVLHVGYGTFLPVRTEDARDHRLGAEWFRIPPETRRAVREALCAGRRVVAVGTTTVRALETMGPEPEGPGNGDGDRRDRSGETGAPGLRETALLILPGYRFRVVSAMLTNFHLPESSLLMLVAALGGVEPVLAAYREAVRERYRFYSYGDAMFVEGTSPAAGPRR